MKDGNIFQNYFLDNQAQKTLIFFHGFMGDHRDWIDITKRIGPQFNYLLIDLPGHGQNKKKRILREDYLIYLNSLISKFGRVSLIGYSMGGRILLSCLKQKSSNIEEIILESVGYGLEDRSDRGERLEADSKLLKGIELKAFLERWYSMDLFGNLNKSDLFEGMIIRRNENHIDDLDYALNEFGLGHQDFLKVKIEEYPKPIFYLVGSHDSKYKKMAMNLSQNNKLKVELVEGAAHNIHLEKPGIFTKLLKSFIKP